MTPERQRIKLAEFCGWKRAPFDTKRWLSPGAIWSHQRGVENGFIVPDCFGEGGLPDYLNDLNAIHEAEEKLSIDQTYVYLKSLEIATHGKLRFNPRDWMKTALIVHATPSQRAEALLRTIGRWTDD